MDSLITEALTNNSDVRTAALSVTQAEAALKNAKLAYLPSFAFSPSASISKAISNEVVPSYAFPITMEWELSLGGRQKAEKDVAKSHYWQSAEELQWTQIQLIASLANAYYTLVMLDRQKAITEESISNQEKVLSTIIALKGVGKANELAVNQSNATLQATKASLTDLELQISKLETSILLLLNRGVDGQVPRSSWEKVASVSMDSSLTVDLKQLSNRPDVRSAEYALAAACGNVRIAKSAFYPTLRISADAGWTNSIGEIVNPAKVLLNLIGSLVQPIFTRGYNKAQLKIANAQREQAEIAFEKALLIAGGEVKDALSECKTAQLKQPIRQMQVAASQTAFDNCIDMLKYSQAVTYLDVLVAQEAVLNAQLLQSADWLEYQQALINLYKAVCPMK